MSYHRDPRILPPGPVGSPYPLVPLSQAPMVPVAQADGTRRLLFAIGAILLILVLAWLVQAASRPKMTKNQAAKKLSTPELAKQLYERLEKRGRANPTVMRSLETYSRR